jgi:hypothetical protein
VYVDNDPLVMVHARALLTSTSEGTTAYAELDVTNPALVLGKAKESLDFDQPIAVLAIALLHFITDDQQASDIIDQLSVALCDGSYLAVSHFTVDSLDELIASKIEKRAANVTDGAFRSRTREQFTTFVAGNPLLDPGICWVDQWRPDPWLLATGALGSGLDHANVYAAVARIDRVAG